MSIIQASRKFDSFIDARGPNAEVDYPSQINKTMNDAQREIVQKLLRRIRDGAEPAEQAAYYNLHGQTLDDWRAL